MRQRRAVHSDILYGCRMRHVPDLSRISETVAEPAGAFVVDQHGARWVPAVSMNRIVLGGKVAFVLAAAVIAWALARRRRG